MPLPLLPDLPAGLFTTPSMTVRPWTDELIDTLGFDPRSAYVERFWLGILGPSTTWFLRRIAAAFDNRPDGIDLVLADMALELGLGHKGGRHSPFMRSVWRCVQFDMARVVGNGLEIRRKLPPLNRRQVTRLPETLRTAHEQWQQAQLGSQPGESSRRRARALAMTLFQFESDGSTVEQRLLGWGVPPAAARDATSWAWGRHIEARAAAG